MAEFIYQEMFPLGKDCTEYRLLSKEHVSTIRFENHDIVSVGYDALVLLAEQAFKDVSQLLRPTHLQLLAKILKDPESSGNDKYVATELLKNAVIAADGIFPMCQDTGTANSHG